MTHFPLLAKITVVIAVFGFCEARLAHGDPAPAATDLAKAQAEAVKRFPELGQEGSLFRQAYLEREAKYRRESPAVLEQATWPLKVAEEVAAGLTTHAVEALKLTREPDPDRGKGASDAAFRIQIENMGTTRPIDAQLKISYEDGEPVLEKRHFPPAFLQIYAYATMQKNVTKVEIVSATFPPRPPSPPPEKAKPTVDGDYAVPVPGKPGFVTSPFAPQAGYVDVRGYAKDTEVKDPYTGKMFLVP